jgi:EAL domain-containing protein (putative c-di-GMP-specific phosphodiesterase class I)
VSRGIALQRPEVFPGIPAGAIALPVAESRVRFDHPGFVLGVGAAVTTVLAALQFVVAPAMGTAWENLYVLASSAAATLTLVLLARRSGPRMLNYRVLGLALALAGAGLTVLDFEPLLGIMPSALLANSLFVPGAVLSLAAIVPALYRLLDGNAALSAGLDGSIILVAAVTVLVTMWRTGHTSLVAPLEFVLPVLSAALFASAGIAIISALSMRIAPSPRGIWCGIVGVQLVGLAWSLWIDRTLHGLPRDGLVSILYSAGVLVVTYAWMTWTEELAAGERYLRLARSLADWLPVAAIFFCVVFAAVPHGRLEGFDLAPIGTAVVILLTIGRQRLLVINERRVTQRLAGEVEERAQTMLSLARLEQADTLEATAGRVCDEALRLEGIDAAVVYAFNASGPVVPLAMRGATRADEAVGDPIDETRAQHLLACASQGTWVDPVSVTGKRAEGSLAAEAFAPMRWDDRIVGVVAMGADQKNAPRLPQRMSTFTEFGVVSAALMGSTLTEILRLTNVRDLLGRVIDDHAFTPVFQAVVRIADRTIVGYEALTRFRDGTRPDVRFLEAHAAGMSVRLETACLAEQIDAATWLPQGTWLSLNVSPALATAVVPLVASLERADRDIVLEITEHVEIGDYKVLVDALDLVRGKARLAVDDAGAGYAGLRHILELRPQFVKLDLSLVRNIDADPARQAMVAGMAHFANDSGCELIAEGIETEAELEELIRLGVGLGQGYLFGKPGPAL